MDSSSGVEDASKDRRAVSTIMVAAIVIVIMLVAIAGLLLTQPGSKSIQTGSTMTPTSSSSGEQNTTESEISSVQTRSESTPSSGQLLMEFTFPGTLVASSDLSSMNYSVTFNPIGSVPSNLSLSVSAPTGLSAQISPAEISLGSTQPQGTLQIACMQNTLPGNYQITMIATGGGSSYKENYTVEVLKYLVVTIGTSFVPQNLTVVEGNSVTWLRLNGALSQYDNGAHDVDFSSGISVISPTLSQYASWSYSFNQTGNYSYYCKYHPFMTGEITVVPSS